MSSDLERLNAALRGRYHLERQLGRGGTATVYLAQDLKHQRHVAVKVLYPQIAATMGTDRFLREVHIAASLTHPHILGLHDSGEADGFLFYVMPYVEGESLRDRVARHGELPIGSAVEILRDVVDALAYAHRRNLVHRDIKPDNVLLAEGHGMVTDFGVAKAVSEAAGEGSLTTAGMALGTPSYMAPEQAAAERHIDHRVDIYAVGALAYELLTGQPPFTGMYAQSVLSAHITQTPEPVGKRRAQVPRRLERFVMTCLEKRPADRWQSADAMLKELEAIRAANLSPAAIRPAPVFERQGTKLAVITGVVVSIAVLGFLGWASLRPDGTTVAFSSIRQVTRAPELELEPAISPDGREVAYTAGYGMDMHVFVRDLSGGRSFPLTADRAGAQYAPRWTPDGRNLLFAESTPDGRRTTYLIPRLGGLTRDVGADGRVSLHGNLVAFTAGQRILIRSLDGGEPTLVVEHPPFPHSVAWSPDGTRLAYAQGNYQFADLETLGNVGPSAIWTAAVTGGDSIEVVGGGSLNVSPVWLPDGRHLLFISNRDGPRDLYVVRLNRDGGPRGAPVRITTGLDPHSISLTADGSVAAYSRFTFRRNIWAVDLPSTGAVSIREARPVTVGNQIVENHGVSRDGRLLAFDSNLEGNQDVYVVPVHGGEPRRLTEDPGDDFHPDFSWDGSEIVFYSTRHGTRDLFLMAADGSNERRLTDSPLEEYHPSLSPDGRTIVYTVTLERQTFQVWVIERDASGGWGEPRVLAENGFYGRWSPDGERLSVDTGEILAVLTRDGTSRELFRWRASGLAPIDVGLGWAEWSSDGRSILFLGRDTAGTLALYRIPAAGGTPRPVVLLDDPTKPPTFGFSLHGNTVYFSVTEYESDVYVMDVEVG